MARLFDRYIAVDWSASSAKAKGSDSIWISAVHQTAFGRVRFDPINPATRQQAMSLMREDLLDAIATGQRVLIGFDFAFGYPRGTASALAGVAQWSAVWALLTHLVEDADDNRNNRYTVAETLNTRLAHQSARFWGHPHQHRYTDLLPRRPIFGAADLPERRLVETRYRGTKAVWQLAYNGSVGSQSLLGIPRLEALRNDPALAPHIAIWPFETRFADRLSAPIVIAEIYPSLLPISPDSIRDRAQVIAVATAMAEADRADTLAGLLAAPDDLSAADRALVLAEEGWILAF